MILKISPIIFQWLTAHLKVCCSSSHFYACFCCSFPVSFYYDMMRWKRFTPTPPPTWTCLGVCHALRCLFWVKLCNSCISFLSAAVTKHHAQGHLQKEGFIWTSGSEVVRGHLYHIGEVWQQADRVTGTAESPTSSNSNRKQREREWVNWEWYVAFKLRACLQWHTFSSKATPP